MAEAPKDFTHEPRWPMTIAVLVAVALTVMVPRATSHPLAWVFAIVEFALLLALVLGDPGKIDRRSQTLRVLAVGLVAVLVVASTAATIDLVHHLIEGDPRANSATTLLRAGGIVWMLNVIAFGFLYWELDGGGAALRTSDEPRETDFSFPQQMDPQLAPPGWRPWFIDYMYVSYTNATAFSPTDAMPLTPRVKVAMALQSASSLIVLGLVIARAVNVFN